jgi:hypothetical protein
LVNRKWCETWCMIQLFVCLLVVLHVSAWLNKHYTPIIWFHLLGTYKETESDVWTQHIKYYNFTTLYCTVYCTYCILTVIYYNTDFNHLWKLLQLSWNTHYRSLPEDGQLRQAETCWRTNKQINNTVQQFGIDYLWI